MSVAAWASFLPEVHPFLLVMTPTIRRRRICLIGLRGTVPEQRRAYAIGVSRVHRAWLGVVASGHRERPVPERRGDCFAGLAGLDRQGRP